MRLLITIVLLSASWVSATNVIGQSNTLSEGNETRRLKERIETFNQAFANCDIRLLESMITDKYIHTNGSSKAISRDKWMDYLAKRRLSIDSGHLRVISYRMDDRDISLYDGSAIVTGRIVIKFLENDQEYHREIRVTNLWVQEAGEWKRAGFHDSRIE
jgi:hypothetical protein